MRKKVEAHQNAVLRLSILELQLIFLSQNFLDIAGQKITERTYVHEKQDFNRGTLNLFQQSVFHN